MQKVSTLIAVCVVAAGIALMSANYSLAAGSNTINTDTVILAKGNGPGDGTGNGGSGPKDGTGNGKNNGTCTQLSPHAQDNVNFIIAGRGNGGNGNNGNGNGNGNKGGTGTGTCTRS